MAWKQKLKPKPKATATMVCTVIDRCMGEEIAPEERLWLAVVHRAIRGIAGRGEGRERSLCFLNGAWCGQICEEFLDLDHSFVLKAVGYLGGKDDGD